MILLEFLGILHCTLYLKYYTYRPVRVTGLDFGFKSFQLNVSVEASFSCLKILPFFAFFPLYFATNFSEPNYHHSGILQWSLGIKSLVRQHGRTKIMLTYQTYKYLTEHIFYFVRGGTTEAG